MTTQQTPVFKQIANHLSRAEHFDKLQPNRADDIMKAIARWVEKEGPSGGGIDCGTKLDPASTSDRIILQVSYHHMDDGSYVGWTEHRVIVKASLLFGIDITVTGRDRAKSPVKDYLGETYYAWLHSQVDTIGQIEDVV